MTKEFDRPFAPVLCLSTHGLGHSHRLMEMMMHRPDPLFLPAIDWNRTPLPEPNLEDLMVDHINPLFHTPAAITRSIVDSARRKPQMTAMLLAVSLTAMTARQHVRRVVGTGALRERLKSLEKNLQKHPGRNDIKLQIMELRNQIRDIESENAKARKAQKAVKGKQRK